MCVFIYIYNSCISAQGSKDKTHSSDCLQDTRKIPVIENKKSHKNVFHLEKQTNSKRGVGKSVKEK